MSDPDSHEEINRWMKDYHGGFMSLQCIYITLCKIVTSHKATTVLQYHCPNVHTALIVDR